MITSRDNPRIRYLRKLTKRKYRKREKRFLLDDRTLIREHLQAGRLPLEIYSADPDAVGPVPATVPIIPVQRELLSPISDQPSFAGSIAVYAMPAPDPATHAHRRVILDGIQDPANLGAILRSAALFDVSSVWLTDDCADPWSLKALRSARSAPLLLSVFRAPAMILAQRIRETDTIVLSADTRGGVALHTVSPPDRWTLIMGSEGSGIRDTLTGCAEQRITIPHNGRIESFNVAAAAAIILYHLSVPAGTG